MTRAQLSIQVYRFGFKIASEVSHSVTCITSTYNGEFRKHILCFIYKVLGNQLDLQTNGAIYRCDPASPTPSPPPRPPPPPPPLHPQALRLDIMVRLK